MATWTEIESDAPEFAARVRAIFEAGTNKTIATLRKDGSPRISGTELQFEDGQVTLGMMPHSMKRRDAERDPRVAIHSPTLEPAADGSWPGDAKFSGLLVPVPRDGVQLSGYYTLDLREVVLTNVEGSDLVVESWHPGRGWRRYARK